MKYQDVSDAIVLLLCGAVCGFLWERIYHLIAWALGHA